MKSLPIRLSLAMLAVVLTAGCASTGVQRTSLDRNRPLSERFDPDDARKTVEFMVDSMLQFAPVVELAEAGRPVLDIAPMQNRTREHIDTRALTTSIRTKLLRTGLFRFKDRASSATDIEIMNEEAELGLVNRQDVVRAGSQSATELYLSGELMDMRTQAGRRIDQYYYIMMTLKDLRSGEIIWTDEQEIRKERTRSIL